MRFTIVLNLVLFCGNALAQNFVPPHIGAVVVGSGGGDLTGFLLAIVGIVVVVTMLVGVFKLFGWLMSLMAKLWRKLCEIMRR